MEKKKIYFEELLYSIIALNWVIMFIQYKLF